MPTATTIDLEVIEETISGSTVNKTSDKDLNILNEFCNSLAQPYVQEVDVK